MSFYDDDLNRGKIQRPFADNAQKILNDLDDKKGDPNLYAAMREKVESYIPVNEDYNYPDKALQDIRDMRDKYVNSGGKDSHFLANLNNLEKFYYSKH